MGKVFAGKLLHGGTFCEKDFLIRGEDFQEKFSRERGFLE
jgi:hypothetical protein